MTSHLTLLGHRIFPILLFIGLVFCKDITVAVLGFENNGLEDSELKILTDEFQSQLIQIGGYKVVERRKIEDLLKEQKYQLSGCVDECMVEIGVTLGAKQIVTGNIGRLGNKYTAIANLVDVSTGEFLNSSSFSTDGDISLLLDGMTQIAYELTDSTLPTLKKRRIEAINYKISIDKILIDENDFTRSGFGNPLNIDIIVYQDLSKIMHIRVGKKRGLIGINKWESVSFNPKSIYKIRVLETDAIISKYYKYNIPSKNGEWPFDKEKISFGRKSHIEVGQDPPFPVDETKYPIYIFLHKSLNEHFLTVEKSIKGNWNSKGIAFFAFHENVKGTVPIYRYLHRSNKDHFYTTNSNPKGNWNHQGVEFYAFPEKSNGTIPIYRYYSKINQDHFYSVNSSAPEGYLEQGIEFHAFPVSSND